MTNPATVAPTARLIGRCTTKGCRIVGSVAVGASRHGCPVHGAMRWKRVQGSFNPNHQCDSRCVNARGLHCDCACAGSNHGKGHAR